MMNYRTLKSKHQKEVDAFPIGFAFSEQQFNEAMEKLGLAPTDTDKVVSIGVGGFIRKSDIESFEEMYKRHDKEMNEAMKDERFAYDMFYYELANHEYAYSYDLEPTFRALGLTEEQVNNDEMLNKAFKKARKDYLKNAW